MTSRTDLRRRMRRQRRALTPSQRIEAAWRMADHLAASALFRNSRRIAAYLPADGEMDPEPLMERAWELGKTVYLPVLVPFGHNRLWFAPYRPGDRLMSNCYGIDEPRIVHRGRISATALDLVLAPLVAFDARGNRLGMGGGYYDRSFGFLRRRRHWQKPRLVGLAYDFQQVEALPAQPWDVPLTAVATDVGLYPEEASRDLRR
ncbi:MAG TPA: 5-formyltetrahydrofolate cyclo-ligase [Gammaproteobacteria bacterium]|nr:5-formyltetrahydrofolate cyclo-ligase [Gammaproteobacteria bacterium]